MNDDQFDPGPYLAPGTKVRYDGSEEIGPEYGIVVHCWLDDHLGLHDCHIAFYGTKFPVGQPNERPYILRYFSTSVTIISD
jgi:hypothetical protein